ncbi:hypothetical protein NDU88_006395 [Pleurodeles waltl]|uniref:Uncharacterized protein n=1 Tax=Pleurodeles waltl TaxID=8319 RepID=A0AAV7M030_PLEWA|nr:hypothetical protein NDU88_006395 [Pleurodeles waltl]
MELPQAAGILCGGDLPMATFLLCCPRRRDLCPPEHPGSGRSCNHKTECSAITAVALKAQQRQGAAGEPEAGPHHPPSPVRHCAALSGSTKHRTTAATQPQRATDTWLMSALIPDSLRAVVCMQRGASFTLTAGTYSPTRAFKFYLCLVLSGTLGWWVLSTGWAVEHFAFAPTQSGGVTQTQQLGNSLGQQ